MMMMTLTTLLVRQIGYCKPEEYMKFVICHSSTATEPRNTSNQKLISIRKGIRTEETSYLTLKDERYFDSFSRKSIHNCQIT